MDQHNLLWGFDVLPAEIKDQILSSANLDLATVLSLQAVSTEFKKLCWMWLSECDTSLLSNEQNPVTNDHCIFTRVNPNQIRRIEFSKFEKPLMSALSLMKRFPNLERINLGPERGKDLPPYLVSEQMEAFDEHPKLREVTYGTGYWCRSKYSKRVDLGSYSIPAFRACYRGGGDQTAPFYQQKPMAFHRAYHRGGSINSHMHVIGATDGTLTFLTLDPENNSLKIHSTDYTSHKEFINTVWSSSNCQALIASTDGIVTSWSCEDNKPVLKHRSTFPESILFVCDHADKYVLAAGKRTLYIAEIDTNKIVREVAVDDDITGLFSLAQKVTFSTIRGLYTLKDDFEIEQLSDRSYPNLCVAPDSSYTLAVQNTAISVIERDTNKDTAPDQYTIEKICQQLFGFNRNTTFDTRPNLAQFSPTRYWMTASTGPSLFTFSLETVLLIAQMGPDIHPLELDPEHLPTCNAFWYSPCGNYLFSLYSNNTLYWWHIRD